MTVDKISRSNFMKVCAGQGIVPETSGSSVTCATDCATRPGQHFIENDINKKKVKVRVRVPLYLGHN